MQECWYNYTDVQGVLIEGFHCTHCNNSSSVVCRDHPYRLGQCEFEPCKPYKENLFSKKDLWKK